MEMVMIRTDMGWSHGVQEEKASGLAETIAARA
jgi:hypothetical protein